MNRFNFLLLLITVSVSLNSCSPKVSEPVFDPYIFAIPDSIATDQQMTIKKALKEITYTKISVSKDRYVFHFDKNDFIALGISRKYCNWLKRNMREENRNYRKLMRLYPDLSSSTSREEIFESAKKNYLENPDSYTETDVVMTDLFRYGAPVTCPEDNIRNLFRNWTDSGAGGGDIQLLSYSYVGTLDKMSQLKKYVRHNNSSEIPSWNYLGSFREGKLSIETAMVERKKSSSRRFDSRALLAHFVSCGDHVFSVKFSYADKEYIYYIFIKPETNRVVTIFNRFGFTFPDYVS